ncbi:hypothetical protein [Chloroflexus sp.]|uniref:hypothetical protein n=1 Tax=Chloroflexus sp. TaxID=1904827 RepID=UPI00260367DF|nr:hypothetical protein [uncultured Chloroflexus sp.]
MVVDIWIILLGLAAGGILLLRDWRLTVGLLMLKYVVLAGLLNEQPFVQPDLGQMGLSSLALIKLITGICTTLILAVTALTFSREYGLEDLDEFGQAELRRALRAAARQRSTETFQLIDYILPFGSGVAALVASIVLPIIYPIAPNPALDFAWYWLALSGILSIATASDILKIGLGMLLCISGIDLLYTAVISDPAASGLKIMPLLLLSVVQILLALAIAYLAGLVYGRLKTLAINELYRG